MIRFRASAVVYFDVEVSEDFFPAQHTARQRAIKVARDGLNDLRIDVVGVGIDLGVYAIRARSGAKLKSLRRK